MCVCVYASLSVRVYMLTYVSVYTYIHMLIYTYVCAWLGMCPCAWGRCEGLATRGLPTSTDQKKPMSGNHLARLEARFAVGVPKSVSCQSNPPNHNRQVSQTKHVSHGRLNSH